MWERSAPASSEGFKNASTGLDGKQYFVPFYYYPWAVHYRKSLFEEKPATTIPTTWDEFKALCDQMQTDGLTPLAGANGGNWPQMGMFDMLNLRINGYDFHVSLMGGQESWTDDRVKDVFTQWRRSCRYYQPDANGRTWQDAAPRSATRNPGCILLGTFVAQNFDPRPAGIIDDIDFFPFPEINEEHGQTAIEAPIDGFMMAASPENAEGAKALLTGLGRRAAIDAYLAMTRRWSPPTARPTRRATTRCSRSRWRSSARRPYIAQFLDRDTEPDFAAKSSVTRSPTSWPTRATSTRSSATVEDQKQTYLRVTNG